MAGPGTTDNSVLTTFPYLMSCADFFVLEGHPVMESVMALAVIISVSR